MKLPFVLICFLSCMAFAQQSKPAAPPRQAPDWLTTPEVHADKSVTFLFRAPNAKDVKLDLEGAEPVPMQTARESGV
jgi:hypothetical protein